MSLAKGTAGRSQDRLIEKSGRGNLDRKESGLSMDIRIHHTIEFNGSAVWVFVLILALVAVCMLSPMLMPRPVLPPDPPKGRLGFR